jgi:phenylalanyl-tRNA synthetase alpha chain
MHEDMKDTGHDHPLSILIRDINAIFYDMGFIFVEGPEMESEHYNFDALNVPKDHPSRDMQDTFFVKGQEHTVMRTHTSPNQVRFMETHEPPYRIIVPGKTFRNEATDATHEAQFFQVEGLMVDRDVTIGHLKGTLETFLRKLMGDDVTMRFRPGYFPFVEPGIEVDMSCFKCSGIGCSVCKQTGWIEILGAGMVHSHVLESSHVDPNIWQGFAFGGGIERLGMMKYGIDDVRLFHTGDLRLVYQF